MIKKIVFSILSVFLLIGCTSNKNANTSPTSIVESESYDDVESVKEYLIQYEHLPNNYMSKKEAKKKGWEGGALHLVIPGKSIGGDKFYNLEETLPIVDGRTYYECDIDTLQSDSRGAKRIIYTFDPSLNIYYTQDHYKTFTKLYGDDDYVGN